MRIKFTFIFTNIYKFIIWILKSSKKGSGTALPGLIAEKLTPWLFAHLSNQIRTKIVITGTNGKTSTQKMISSILDKKGIQHIRNKAGANLKRGLLSEMIKNTNFFGQIHTNFAIFEVEEATLPQISKILDPQFLIVTNLYRDQLDAYGEVDITEKYIKDAIKLCPNSTLILNGDDPRVSRLGDNTQNQTYFFTLPLEYSKNIAYESQNEKIQIKNNEISAQNIKMQDNMTYNFDIVIKLAKQKLYINNILLNAHGYFFIYNALASGIVAHLLDIDDSSIKFGLESFSPAFGRGENIKFKSKEKEINFKIFLIKNPAGFSLNLEILNNIKDLKLMIIINDNTADGKDVSWLWDANLENLNEENLKWIIFSGTRAFDIQVRCKYALNNSENIPHYAIHSIKNSIDKSIELCNHKDTVYILPTYTAMLEFRKLLGKNIE